MVHFVADFVLQGTQLGCLYTTKWPLCVISHLEIKAKKNLGENLELKLDIWTFPLTHYKSTHINSLNFYQISKLENTIYIWCSQY